MKFSCDDCHAQYMIADEKIGTRGVKVRCKKCQNVIVVKPQAAAIPDDATRVDMGGGMDSLAAARVAAIAAHDASQAAASQAAASQAAASQAAEADKSPTGMDAEQTQLDPSAGLASAAHSVSSTEMPSSTANESTAQAEQSDSGQTDGAGAGELTEAFDSLFASGAATGFEASSQTAGTMDEGDKQQDTYDSSASEGGGQEWYVAVGDAQIGPVDMAEVEQRWHARDIEEDSLAWKAGMPDWVAIAEIPELAYLLTEYPHQSSQNTSEFGGGDSAALASFSAAPSGGAAVASQYEAVNFGGAAAGGDVTWRPSAASSLAALVDGEIQAHTAAEALEQNEQAAIVPAGLPSMASMGASMGGAGASAATDMFSARSNGGESGAGSMAAGASFNAGFGGANAGFSAGAVDGFSLPTASTSSDSGSLKAVIITLVIVSIVGLGGAVTYLLNRQAPVAAAPVAVMPPVAAPAPVAAVPVHQAVPVAAAAVPVKAAAPIVKASRAKSSRSSKRSSKKRKVRSKSSAGVAAVGAPDKAKLSIKDIVAGVKKNARMVMPCLKAARAKGEISPGKYKLILDWQIKPSGGVAKAKLKGPSIVLGTSLPGCFASAMQRWKFPSSNGGAPVKNFPFGPFTIK